MMWQGGFVPISEHVPKREHVKLFEAVGLAAPSMSRNCPLNIVGRQVARIRNSKHMSQAGFAAACQLAGWDVSRETIAKIESGFRWVGDFELIKLAGILGVKIGDLFPDDCAELF